MFDQQRRLIHANVENLRKQYELHIDMVKAVEQPHLRLGAIRNFNAAWDRYNSYVGEALDWCQQAGVRVSAKTKTAPLFENITGPEIERQQFRKRPPSQFLEAA